MKRQNKLVLSKMAQPTSTVDWRGFCWVLLLALVGLVGCQKMKSPMPPRAVYKPSPKKSKAVASRRLRRKPAARRTAPVANMVAVAGDVAESEKKAGGKDGKKNKPQVWQRSKTNTVLSKVSVGGGKYLILNKMRVSVYVEGLRARTVIDHIYFNPHNRTLQGTFKYTLPAGASISYYSMFVGQQRRRTPRFFSSKGGPQPRRLAEMQPAQIARLSPKKEWGKLREARLVAAEKGREVYEEIARQRIDPALLEQDAPNTFTGRVFPIPSKGYNRVILAYEQTLQELQGNLVYRFRFPNEVAKSIDFSMQHDGSLSTLSQSNLRKIRCNSKAKKGFLRCYWEENKPDRDAVFYFKPKNKMISWVAGTDPVNSKKYVMARMKLNFPVSNKITSSPQAMFMLDTSLSANPDLFAAHVQLLQEILKRNAPHLKRFNVLLFDVSSRWVNPNGWMKNTAANRKRLMAQVQKIVLEGATNFNRAMQDLAKPTWKIGSDKGLDVFVLSDGQLNWGESQVDAVLAGFRRSSVWGATRFFAYKLGIGSENTSLYQRLVRKGGAVFTCLGRSEMARCATAHQRPALFIKQVNVEGVNASEILVAGRQTSVYPGGAIEVAAQIAKVGQATFVVQGQLQGKPVTLRATVTLTPKGELAPRAWGELAVQQLMELDDPSLTNLVVAYSQHFQIPNEHCSFLVLETDKEYKQYGLEKTQKTLKLTDVAQFILDWMAKRGKTRTLRERWIALLRKGMKRSKMLSKSSGRAVMSLVNKLQSADFAMGSSPGTKAWTKSEVPASYLKTRLKDRNVFDGFTKEAERRVKVDVGGAVRALSCIVELHPRNPQALRLVGYYLMGWKRPSEAAQVFLRVLERRSFEPHSYRDLARALIKRNQFALAAALYEILLAGTWHSRFGRIQTIAREEYAMLVRQALRTKELKPEIQSILERRKSMLGLKVNRSKLRVTVTWNTDNTDIDLWVIEPGGEKCYYSHRKTRNGGSLLDDITRGYGPERYEHTGNLEGKYNVKLHFYGHRSNVLGNETHASVVMVMNAGTPNERVVEKNLILKKRQSVVQVAELKL